jgi:hypothetical protein
LASAQSLSASGEAITITTGLHTACITRRTSSILEPGAAPTLATPP